MDRYQLSCAAETVEACDARVRRSARLSREAFDAVIGKQELIIRAPAERSRGALANYRLPRRVTIEDVKVRRMPITDRDVTINFSDQGRSDCYAVQLRRGTMTRWLVILGISGQVIAVNSEEEADALLSL